MSSKKSFGERFDAWFPVASKWTTIIGTCIKFLTTIGIVAGAYKQIANPHVQAVFILLGVITGIALGAYCYYYYQFNIYRAKYKKTSMELYYMKAGMEDLNKAFSHVHASIRTAAPNEDTVQRELTFFCTHFASALEKVTGQKCYACIKLTGWQESNFKDRPKNLNVITLCRDAKNSVESRIIDDKKLHVLADNTDFMNLYTQIDRVGGDVFFSNNLIEEQVYKNSSFVLHGHSSCDPFTENQTSHNKATEWKLPYKSCIVAPIRLKGNEANPNERRKKLQGFLCVDAEETNAFEDFHKKIVVGTAEALYNTLRNYKENHIKN